MRRKLGAWLAALSVVGCATTWEHPFKSEQEWYQDSAECEAMAGQAAQGTTGWASVYVRNSTRDNCLRGRGWREQE